MKGGYRHLPILVDPSDANLFASTCEAHYAKDLSTRLGKDKRGPLGVRPFTVLEYSRLQDFPDDFHFENKRLSYKLIGNAVPVHMGAWVGSEALR